MELSEGTLSLVTNSQLEEIVSEIYSQGATIFESMLAHASMSNEMILQNTEATGSHPCSEEWEGPYGFSLCVPSNLSKTPYVYSSQLRKVFLPMNSSLPIHFTCKTFDETGLYIRALPVFLDADDIPKPITRCFYHSGSNKEELDANFPFQKHIIRCENNSSCYVKDSVSERLSVITPLGNPSPGTNHIVQHYRFVCKTSCMGGMNRRPIQVIFTLERNGEVLGRSAVKIRICSCPKRDMLKEEKNALAKPTEGQLGPGDLIGNTVPEVTDKSGKRLANSSIPLHTYKNKIPKFEQIKIPKFEPGSVDNVIPIKGDNNVLKKFAKILRIHILGEKAAAGEELTFEDRINVAIFSSIIGEEPEDGENRDDPFSSS